MRFFVDVSQITAKGAHVDDIPAMETCKEAARARNVRWRLRLLPFGPGGNMLLFLILLLASTFLLMRFPGLQFLPVAVIALALCLPVVGNLLPSGFSKEREVLGSFWGGGRISIFRGRWPMFRILLYRDGLEVRAEFNRYFLPYDRLMPLPELVGFFHRTLLLRCRLPGVPSKIRFDSPKADLLRARIEELSKASAEASKDD
jgi:hypothetical protein